MKQFYIFVFFSLFINLNFAYSNSIYETNFYPIHIQNDDISKIKNQEIEKIKFLSLENIYNKVLLKKEKNRINRLLNSELDLDKMIKNIIIENEFISSNLYKSDIKINFDYIEIINLLRSKKINYTDLQLSDILILSVEKNQLSINGLSQINNLYKFFLNNDDNFLKFIIPDLSANDRYLMSKEKIINKDIKSLIQITNKYKSNFALIINTSSNLSGINFNFNLFSNKHKKILPISIENFSINFKDNYNDELFNYLNKWWKYNFQINNSKINKLLCNIINLDINELYLINSKINSLSQIKSNIVSKLQYQNNKQILTFYGDFNILVFSLLIKDIDIKINDKNECIIKTIN